MVHQLVFDLDDLEALAYCSECGAPYVVPPAKCTSCHGTAFIDREQAARLNGAGDSKAVGVGLGGEIFQDEDDDSLLVPLVSTDSRSEDAMVQDVLTEAGIGFLRHEPPTVFGLHAGDWGRVRYSVNEDDYEAATEALDQLEAEIEQSAPTVDPASERHTADAQVDEELDQLRGERLRHYARLFMILHGIGSLAVIVGMNKEPASLGTATGFGLLAAATVACAIWSRSQPQRGFFLGLIFMSISVIVSFFLAGAIVSAGGTTAIVGAWFAWNSSRKLPG